MGNISADFCCANSDKAALSSLELGTRVPMCLGRFLRPSLWSRAILSSIQNSVSKFIYFTKYIGFKKINIIYINCY